MDPYSILGLQQGATEDDAKAAFRKLAKTCHPDLHPNDPDAERKFKEINAAYDVICKGVDPDPVQYTRTSGFRNFDDIFFNQANNPFHDMFREMHMRRGNHDTNLIVPLTLEESFNGKELNISVQNGTTTRTVTAQIPPGLANGMRVRVPNGGNQPNMTLPPGDLYITIKVLPHHRFRRENNNLIMVVPVSVFDVLLKKDVEVINIEGQTLSVNLAGSKILRLAGQGMPDPMNKVRGDLMVELFVQYPELTEEQQALILQASELGAKEPVM